MNIPFLKDVLKQFMLEHLTKPDGAPNGSKVLFDWLINFDPLLENEIESKRFESYFPRTILVKHTVSVFNQM
jgi:hypothetical protein